jgi:hypothetical protein
LPDNVIGWAARACRELSRSFDASVDLVRGGAVSGRLKPGPEEAAGEEISNSDAEMYLL